MRVSRSHIVKNILLILISILFGTMGAVLFSDNGIPFVRNIVKTALLLAVLILSEYTAATLLSYFLKNTKIKLCFKEQGIWLLTASTGTIVTSILAMGFVLYPDSLTSVILTGIEGFFFFWMMLSNYFFIKCLADKTIPLTEI